MNDSGELDGAKDSRPLFQEEIRAHLRKRKSKQPSQRRPPAARDVQIYERAVIQEVPQRQVAAEFGITQGAVSRKCAKVIAWMSRCGQEELRGMNLAEGGRYLYRFAERKYDHYREQAEAAHRLSLEPQVILVESGEREAQGAPGEFEGTVTIRKTTRPQSGKPSYLREARLAVDSMVLLQWGRVGGRKLEVIPDPDEVARKKQLEEHKRTLEWNRRLEWELERAQEEIANLRKEAELARDSLPPTGSPHDTTTAANESLPAGMTLSEWLAIGPPGAGQGEDVNPEAASGGRDSFAAEVKGGGELFGAKDSRPHLRPKSPSEGLASRQREADGLAFLEEVKQLIASIDPLNTSDATYRKMLMDLYEVLRNNYRHHGVIPERQHLPTLRGVRSGVPFSISIPQRLYKGRSEAEWKAYWDRHLRE